MFSQIVELDILRQFKTAWEDCDNINVFQFLNKNITFHISKNCSEKVQDIFKNADNLNKYINTKSKDLGIEIGIETSKFSSHPCLLIFNKENEVGDDYYTDILLLKANEENEITDIALYNYYDLSAFSISE